MPEKLQAHEWVKCKFRTQCGRCKQPIEVGEPLGISEEYVWLCTSCGHR